MFLKTKLLSRDQVSVLSALLEGVGRVDGRQTAGPAGQAIKENIQYETQHPDCQEADKLVRNALLNCQQYQRFAYPYKVTPIRFSAYEKGMHYGEHLDAVVMSAANDILRADLAFTLFLCGPDEYDGGELVVDLMGVEHIVKGELGEMFVYPAGNRHRVNTVARGCRRVGVGWVQSLVASTEKRNVLTTLTELRARTLSSEGKSKDFDLLSDAVVTLERMWIAM